VKLVLYYDFNILRVAVETLHYLVVLSVRSLKFLRHQSAVCSVSSRHILNFLKPTVDVMHQQV